MRFWNAKGLSGVVFTGTTLFMLLVAFQAQAQNSPYSRFGLGDLSNNQSVTNRAMGGVAQAYADGQSINFINPASYAELQLTTLGVGLDLGNQKITDKDNNSYKSTFGTLSYIELGVPLKQGGGWGLTFGLTPLTNINYNIQHNDSLKGVGNEQVAYLFQGDGGSYQAFIGTGYRIKGFRFGVNAGYLFGSKKQSTQAIYPPDSVGLFNSNSTMRTSFGGFFWNAGVQVHVKLSKELGLELGATGGSSQKLSASQDYLAETFYSSGDPSNPSPQNLDTVAYVDKGKGKVLYPGHYGVGFLLHDNAHWTVGADYQMSKWGDYRFFGQKDSMQDSWKLRLGAQFVPSINPIKAGYWSMVAYRVGFYTGKEPLRYQGESLQTYAFTFGLGLPIRNYTRNGQYALINTSFEIGKTGGDANPLSETFFRFSVGFDLSDMWFIKHKYQ
ncbi:MAG TPA: hypothetical protein VFX43_14155 [Chitinophagaceae bacterium]|jgi:hypothetical protein|nr:hypothetical protein [Chitinophagaceae bacterium]